METHDGDHTSHDEDTETDPWDRVTTEFEDLKEGIAATYRRVSDGSGPTEKEIRDALAILASAWDQVAESVTTALRDPDVRQRLKSAAGSFASAFGTTITDLGSELREDHHDGDSAER